MKKVLMILGVIILVFILLSLGFGFGMGAGDGNSSGDGTSNESVATDVNEEKNDKEMVEESQEIEVDNKEVIYSITVVETEYFYDNNRIALEDFIDMIKQAEGKVIVEIMEDKASLKVYNKLVDALDEVDIDYVEK